MSVANALKFIEQGLDDNALRRRLNSASTESELKKVLADETFTFSKTEFHDAFILRLTQCQETEAADQLNEFRLWWGLLQKSLEPETCPFSCSGCKV